MTRRLTPVDQLPASLTDELVAAGIDVPELYAAVVRALDEDFPGGREVDITSEATIAADATGSAVFAAREEGVVSGLGVAALVFHVVAGDAVTVTGRVADGTRVGPGDVVMTVSGPTRGLLTAERTALNYASHFSGVATATSRWVDAVSGTRARVLDTRKTLPGLRALEKYAVRCGGGLNHRMGLSDMALIKDNHVVAAGGVVPAYRAVRAAYPDVPVEVEVTTLAELEDVLAAGATRVLLDNMSPDDLRRAVELGDGRAEMEASGGLTLEQAGEVAATGVDYISVGELTHSVTVFDLGLDLRATAEV